jgi:spermidine synthase
MKDIISKKLLEYGRLTDKVTYHSYGSFYDGLFDGKLNKKIRMMEIGVSSFGSILTWMDCLPNAEIVGVDINFIFGQSNQAEMCKKNDRVTLIEADATKKEFDVKGQFDVIIDDGSHIVEDVEKSFKNLFSKIKKGGSYVIEDVKFHNQLLPKIENVIKKEYSNKAKIEIFEFNIEQVKDDRIYQIKKM